MIQFHFVLQFQGLILPINTHTQKYTTQYQNIHKYTNQGHAFTTQYTQLSAHTHIQPTTHILRNTQHSSGIYTQLHNLEQKCTTYYTVFFLVLVSLWSFIDLTHAPAPFLNPNLTLTPEPDLNGILISTLTIDH